MTDHYTDHYPVETNRYDIVVNQMTPGILAPISCMDGRIRIYVRHSNLRDGMVWAFYIGKAYVRYLTYPMIPMEVRELLAQLLAETSNVDSNVTTSISNEFNTSVGHLYECPLPPMDVAGYKVSDKMYVLYVSQQAFEMLADTSHSYKTEEYTR